MQVWIFNNLEIMKIKIIRDWDWYLAKVEWVDNLYAFDYTEEKAKIWLLDVIEMNMDYHMEQLEMERKIKNELLGFNFPKYAV